MKHILLHLLPYMALLFLSLFVTTTTVCAQMDEQYLPKLSDPIFPSPTSRVYTRYPGYKPDMATGAINVSIPLYTATEGNLSIPFTLNYHSNGVKVMDNHFPFGYTWVMTPGLRITRTIMGKADETCEIDVKTDNFTYKYLWDIYYRDSDIDAAYDFFTIDIPGHNSPFLLKKTMECGKRRFPILL